MKTCDNCGTELYDTEVCWCERIRTSSLQSQATREVKVQTKRSIVQTSQPVALDAMEAAKDSLFTPVLTIVAYVIISAFISMLAPGHPFSGHIAAIINFLVATVLTIQGLRLGARAIADGKQLRRTDIYRKAFAGTCANGLILSCILFLVLSVTMRTTPARTALSAESHANQEYKATDLPFTASGLALDKGGRFEDYVTEDHKIKTRCSGMSLTALYLGASQIALNSSDVTSDAMIVTRDYGNLLLKMNMATHTCSILVTPDQEEQLRKLLSQR